MPAKADLFSRWNRLRRSRERGAASTPPGPPFARGKMMLRSHGMDQPSQNARAGARPSPPPKPPPFARVGKYV